MDERWECLTLCAIKMKAQPLEMKGPTVVVGVDNMTGVPRVPALEVKERTASRVRH